ncbi:MAG: alpha/beta fold hydrolase, partial [Deltaproteobacteria bacterium]
GRRLDLFVGVVPAVAGQPEPDPLVLLAGGPGQAATESFVTLPQAFTRIGRRRDIVLLDQRGTGRSHPLDCEVPADLARAPGGAATLARRCLAAISVDADPRLYTTGVAVEDLEAVRRALGYEQLNLYGISYGSRVALAYLRRYPERVRSAILDGVVPADVALGPGMAQSAQDSLDATLARCEADAACAAAFPELRAHFAALAARLEADPIELALRDPASGEPTRVRMTRDRLAGAVRLLSYAPETTALLPLLIETAYRGDDLAPLAAQSLILERQLAESFSYGMQFSVACTEDVPFADRAPAALEATYLGSHPFDLLREVCAHWPVGVRAADFREPVVSDVPVLLLSGELDPITPPDHAERAARTLRRSRHLVAPGQGHGVAIRGCIPGLMSRFVEAGNADAIDADCIARMEPVPFFLRMSGPAP